MPLNSLIVSVPHQPKSGNSWRITPKVSVSIITYNHEKYIAQAIDSVLKQRVTFHYEIIIGDDCSSDGTRQILQAYQQKYPDVIQLVLHPHRYQGVPGRLNNITNLYACRGQYVALLDGDDYWISEDKLQQQVDFLDKNHNYALAFHDAVITSDENAFTDYNHSDEFDFLKAKESFTHSDVAERWFMQTSSIMYRNKLLGEFPNWFWNIYSADYVIQLLISQHGKVRYFHNLKSVRRKNQASFSATQNQSLHGNLRRIEEMILLRKEFKQVRSSASFSRRLAKYYYRHASLLRKQKSYSKAANYLLKCIYADWKYFTASSGIARLPLRF
ncbi:glycosyltransferase family 2 protein [Tunicatimonas pelagia]|uniref:glycosyltransferase family 2 protein n=1 Tax=Tunicatimonas pelagia TaxID=931531 RepID=UPI0026654CFA|nr:glycosyltransferase [Tunicatimonas pelagia]WKN45147.1 glycosyltransferase [Tunicatimonas pelagia]